MSAAHGRAAKRWTRLSLMKAILEHIRERTLDELEGGSSVTGDSYLQSEMRRLRRVPLREFRLEDLRLLIGQGIGLPYLVPMALSHLQEHPLASGHFYPGDLLKQVMTVDEAFLGVEPVEIASDHAVFALQPRELAAVLAASADPRELPGFGSSDTARGALPNTRMEPTRAGS